MSAPHRSEGAAADAIRDAEASLVRQNSMVAQVDLQVVTAVLNAHTVHGAGAGALDALQREIETAVVTRTDLDTPAGARSFQRYLTERLHDIRAVVDGVSLDDTSRATLAAALASLYASSGRDSGDGAGEGAGDGADDSAGDGADTAITPDDLFLPLAEESGGEFGSGSPEDPQAMPVAPAQPPALPSWGGGGSVPSTPFGGLSESAFGGLSESLPGRLFDDPEPEPQPGPEPEPDPEPEPSAEEADEPAAAGDPRSVALPDGRTISAPTPELAAVITAAIAGTPIPEAFSGQGITIAPPGSPVEEPLAAADLAAGDIGILADRHALALGDGTALLDGRIQPIADVSGPGFIGWQHPPGPDPMAEGEE